MSKRVVIRWIAAITYLSGALYVLPSNFLRQLFPGAPARSSETRIQNDSFPTNVVYGTATNNGLPSVPASTNAGAPDIRTHILPEDQVITPTTSQESLELSTFGMRQPDPETLRVHEEKQHQVLREHFELQLSAEARDQGWEQELVGRATEALRLLPALTTASLSAALCGETLCRMTFTAADDEAFRYLSEVGPGVGVLLGSDAWTTVSETEHVVEVFVSRPGEQLPLGDMG